jgi:hypothetical protein
MSWFLVKIVYRIICGAGDHKSQFDEQLRLVQATTQQQALKKAQQVGISEQMTFRNNKDQLVQWKFVDVCEVYRLDEITDGTEIYSRIEEKDDALIYEDIVHAKARYLLKEVNAPHLQEA